MGHVYLIIAVIEEVIATSAFKVSDEFSKLIPTIIVFIWNGIAFYLLTLVFMTISLGTVYALWSGLVIYLVVLIGAFYYNQSLDLPAILELV